jgi:hypothetical protein
MRWEIMKAVVLESMEELGKFTLTVVTSASVASNLGRRQAIAL